MKRAPKGVLMPLPRSVLLLLSCIACAQVDAVTLDWSAVSWTNGSLSNSYNIDPSSAGNDITVTIAGNTSQLVPDILVAGNPQTPAITSAFQGGLSSIHPTLDLAVNFSTLGQSVSVTVTFSSAYTAGVKNVSFSLFDVDFSNSGSTNTYQDEIRSITATTISNTTVAATITGSTNNSVTGSGTAQKVDGRISTVDTGTGSGNANVTINFGTNAIKSFTFTYGSGTGIPLTNPTFEHIGIYNIGYTPVPEMNPALATAFSCAAAALFIVFHRGRSRKKRF